MLYTYIFYDKYFSVSELSAISTYPVSARVLYSPVHDFAELDVFLGQHILLTLEQHFNPKM